MAATPEQLTQQVIALGNDLKQAQSEIKQLKDKIGKLGAGGAANHKHDSIIDRKKLYPEAYKHGDAWGEWRDHCRDFIEECNEGWLQG